MVASILHFSFRKLVISTSAMTASPAAIRGRNGSECAASGPLYLKTSGMLGTKLVARHAELWEEPPELRLHKLGPQSARPSAVISLHGLELSGKKLKKGARRFALTLSTHDGVRRRSNVLCFDTEATLTSWAKVLADVCKADAVRRLHPSFALHSIRALRTIQISTLR